MKTAFRLLTSPSRNLALQGGGSGGFSASIETTAPPEIEAGGNVAEKRWTASRFRANLKNRLRLFFPENSQIYRQIDRALEARHVLVEVAQGAVLVAPKEIPGKGGLKRPHVSLTSSDLVSHYFRFHGCYERAGRSDRFSHIHERRPCRTLCNKISDTPAPVNNRIAEWRSRDGHGGGD